tara:strand:- start:9453 stop:9833 length:381 start_codon:yes stop_codon:yes gene_type:complete
MANSSELTNVLANKLVNKYEYRGNVQAITVSIKDATSGNVQVADTLPEKARIVFMDLVASAGNITDVGTSADEDAYITGHANSRLVTPNDLSQGGDAFLEVGGSDLTIKLGSSATVLGVILIVTNE